MDAVRILSGVLSLYALLASCNESAFTGSTRRQESFQPNQPAKNRPPADKYLKLACENGTGEARLMTEVAGGLATTVSLEGEFCGMPAKSSSGTLSVFFVIDMSGSMALSDPVSGQSCGRLNAMRALLDKLNQTAKSGLEIKVGVGTFGNDAQVGIPLSPIEQVRARLTRESICRQDAGGTNYEAALVTAKSAIENAVGPKAVYFISDGLPSVSIQSRRSGGGVGSGGDVSQIYNAGIQAAEALRAVPGATLDVVYLDSAAARSQAEQIAGSVVEEPSSYVEKIAGSKDRVRLVTSAAELANQITTFDNPTEVVLKAESVKGLVSAGGYGSQEVKLRSLTRDPARPGIWQFVTEAFKLYGKTGLAVDNEVTLTVNGADGKIYKATAVIKFATDD